MTGGADDLGTDWIERGLSSSDVQQRIADGRVNKVPDAPTRTTGQIIAANVFTPINLIVGLLLVLVVIASGISPDMLFGGVIISNSLIGIYQEFKARSALNRLAVLTAPHATVVRDGEVADLDVDDVVADDLLVLAPGAQIVVDGTVVASESLDVNESLLTGESDPVHKKIGDEVLSGSFVASGSGRYRAVKVGGDSYAAGLADEARRFTLVDSELRAGVNKILRFLMFMIPPIAAILMIRLMGAGEGWRDALSGVVAASVAMVPDGLVLLTSLAFMAGVVSLARRQALLRELASVELLARVDTLCLDKTGTITTGAIVVGDVVDLGGAGDLDQLLAAFGHADPEPNATAASLAEAYPDSPGWTVEGLVPFSSARKWSAAQVEEPSGSVALYLGAPEFLLGDTHSDVANQVSQLAGDGNRVVLLATAPALEGEDLPSDLEPRAILLLRDEVRDDAAETLAFFQQQGVQLKVISGDHPGTVAAVARRAGVPNAETGIDARELPEDNDELADVLGGTAVFGRVTPRQKRAMVKALQSRGHVVAMTGDGVNDVLALKDADMGISMGSGAAASRSVAQLVLMDNRFSTLPGVLAEGRRVMNSVERASNLFIYGTVYAVVITAVIAITGVPFPFLPRHLTLVRMLSVGLPGFFLALAPDPRRTLPGFLDRVIRFAIPAGGVGGVAALIVYFVARSMSGLSLTQERTAATITLLGIGLGILLRLSRPLPWWRWPLVGTMAAGMVAALALPVSRTFFDLDLPPSNLWWVIAGAVAVAQVLIYFVPVGVDGDRPEDPALATPT